MLLILLRYGKCELKAHKTYYYSINVTATRLVCFGTNFDSRFKDKTSRRKCLWASFQKILNQKKYNYDHKIIISYYTTSNFVQNPYNNGENLILLLFLCPLPFSSKLLELIPFFQTLKQTNKLVGRVEMFKKIPCPFLVPM